MLHRVWKGVVGDNHMYHSSSPDGLTWTDQRQIRGRTSHGPALAVFNQRLHRAWKADDTSKIHHSSSSDGLTWTDAQPIPDAYTSHGPALAVYNDTLYLAYRGSNTYIYMSSLSPDGQWSSPRRIAGRTSHSPALSAGGTYYRLYCLWKGEGTDTRMFISTSDHPDGPAGSGNHIWSPPQQVGGRTSHGPALTLGPVGLYRLWKNSTDNTMLISIGSLTRSTSSSVDIEWTAKQPISGLTSNTPSLVRFGL